MEPEFELRACRLQAHKAERVKHSMWSRTNRWSTHSHSPPANGLDVPGCLAACQSSGRLLISQPETFNQGRSGGQAGEAGQSQEATGQPGCQATRTSQNDQIRGKDSVPMCSARMRESERA